jgi:hypothetical protein
MRASLLALVATALLAGCFSGGGGSPSGPDPADPAGLGLQATPTTGLIRGIVVDQAIRPLANVTVELAADPPREARTNADGAFGFDALAPGTYFLKVSKLGYFPAQQSAEVVAGVAAPDVVKVQLAQDVSFRAYHEAVVYEGFIECTTSFLVLCGAPNTLEPSLCGGLDPLPPVCYGTLTNDRFTFTLFFGENVTLVQSELVWTSTQAASPELSYQQESLNADESCEDTTLSEDLNHTDGASPIMTRLHRNVLEEYTIGPVCGVYYSVFSGDATGDPTGQGVDAGVTVQQRFSFFIHAFYGYVPPADWRFSDDSTVPPPPV